MLNPKFKFINNDYENTHQEYLLSAYPNITIYLNHHTYKLYP